MDWDTERQWMRRQAALGGRSWRSGRRVIAAGSLVALVMALNVGLGAPLAAAASGTAATITVALAPSSIVADGSSTTTATATVLDVSSAPVTGDTVTFSSDGSQAINNSTVIDHGDGTYSVIITSSTSVGPAIITASETTASLSNTATLTQTAPGTPPVNTSLPAVSGSTVLGQTLSASSGTWTGSPAPSFAYQWQRCNSGGGGCGDIGGATGSSYTLVTADVSSTVRVVVTGSNSQGSVAATSNATAVVSGPPVNTSLPAVSGSTVLGQTLSASSGGWTGSPAPSFAYQWQRCNSAGSGCVGIGGATGSSYLLVAADVSSTVRVVVTASSSQGSVAAASNPTAVVTATFFVSTTTVSVSPPAPVTNQSVTMSASVVVSGGAPVGTVTFDSGGTPIGGCTSVPVSALIPAAVVTCSTSFTAAASPHALTATFTAAAATSLTNSTSAAVALAVGPDATTTGLQVSASSVAVKATVTYTATVAPTVTGPAAPSGTVKFIDAGKPIQNCASQPLVQGSATCTETYSTPGTHTITAQYSGDASFAGSASSPADSVTATAPPTLRTVATTMRWTFFRSPTYSKILSLVVSRAPAGGRIIIKCSGAGCPFGKSVVTVPKRKTCHAKPGRPCRTPQIALLNLTSRFRSSHLHVGSLLVIEVVKSGMIGKYYGFKIEAHAGPAVRIACLAPGGSRPGVGC
jgi:Bacterial Ig-like domain (group 3)/Invasin, domain 3